MGFAGNVCHDRQQQLIETALKKGVAKFNRTNVEIRFQGEAYSLVTYEGVVWTASGMLEFRHYGSRVLAVDFTRDRISDFGFTGHSMTTNKYLSAWKRALSRMAFQDMECLRCETDTCRWTATNLDYFFGRGQGYTRDMFMRFRAGVPWVKTINGCLWFCGHSYRPVLEDHYNQLRAQILSDGVSWNWFTADWNARGQWAKRFINDAAKVRWETRQAKRAREAARQLKACDKATP